MSLRRNYLWSGKNIIRGLRGGFFAEAPSNGNRKFDTVYKRSFLKANLYKKQQSEL